MDKDQLEKRLLSLEKRIATLEEKTHITQAPSSLSIVSKSSKTKGTSGDWHVHSVKPGNVMAFVAILCFILAGAFIIELAISSGWLTPLRQLAIAAVFGLSLIVVGLVFLRTDREYFSWLPAAGIIILYLTIFAAAQYYFIITADAALVLSFLNSLLCIYLFLEIRHSIYALTAATGAYLSPIILITDMATLFNLFYYVLCSLTFAVIAVKMKTRLLIVLASYLAITVTAYSCSDLNINLIAACVLALHFVIFSASNYYYSKYNNETMTVAESWCFFPVLLLFYSFEYHFLYKYDANLAPWISLIFAVFILNLYFAAGKYFIASNLNSLPMLLAFVSIIVFHSLYLEILPPDYRVWLFGIMLLIFAYFPQNKVAFHEKKFFIPGLLIFFILATEYLSMLNILVTTYPRSNITVINFYYASIFALTSLGVFYFRKHNYLIQHEPTAYALLAMAHFLCLSALYRLTMDISSLAVSLSWLAYAILILMAAYSRRDKLMAKSDLIVLSFAAGKALLYDAASAPTLIRILCLLVTGIVLYSAGYLMKQINEWKSS